MTDIGTTKSTDHGLILIAKPAGWTSHDVVAKVRSILGIQKVGHTGTLDPDATGVLPVCIGRATKLSQYLLLSDKEYRVTMKLGETTDTLDGSGKRTGGAGAVCLQEETLRSVLREFVGRVSQVPPMYSAVKIGGVPLYRMARRGIEVERKPREVEIREILLLNVDQERVTFDVVCSKGTYIRTLCADIGTRLGVGGHMYRLTRTRTGPFSVTDAISLEELESLVRQGLLHTRLIPPDRMVEDLPSIRLYAYAVKRVLQGAPVDPSWICRIDGVFQTGAKVRLTDEEGGLLGIGIALRDHAGDFPGGMNEKIVRIDRILV